MAVFKSSVDVHDAEHRSIGTGMAYVHLRLAADAEQRATGTVSLRRWEPADEAPASLHSKTAEPDDRGQPRGAQRLLAQPHPALPGTLAALNQSRSLDADSAVEDARNRPEPAP